MLIALFIACLLPNKELIGDSDRPFSPPLSDFDSNDENDDAELDMSDSSSSLSITVQGSTLQIEHTNVPLPCNVNYDDEMTVDVDTDDYFIEIIYSEREPDGCYFDLDYELDFTDAPSGNYLLTAQGDDAYFEIE